MQKSSSKWPDAPIYTHFLGKGDKLRTYRDETRQPRAKKNPSRTWVLQGGFTDTHADLMCCTFLCNCVHVSSMADYLSVIVSLRTTCPDSQLVKLDSKSWTATLIPNTKWFVCSDKCKMKTLNPHKVELFIWWLSYLCFKKGCKSWLAQHFSGLKQSVAEKNAIHSNPFKKVMKQLKKMCISPIIDLKPRPNFSLCVNQYLLRSVTPNQWRAASSNHRCPEIPQWPMR